MRLLAALLTTIAFSPFSMARAAEPATPVAEKAAATEAPPAAMTAAAPTESAAATPTDPAAATPIEPAPKAKPVLETKPVPADLKKAEEAPLAQLKLGPTTWTVKGEFQFRFEWRNYDLSFDSSLYDQKQRSFDFMRTRLGLEVKWAPVTLFVEGVDSQEFVTPSAKRSGFNPLDLQSAYVEVQRPADLPLMVKVGRQEFNPGSKLLISTTTWPNFMRTYDLARAGGEGEGWMVTGFFGRPVQIDPTHPSDLNGEKTGENLFGAYGSYRAMPELTLDLYYLGLHDQARPDPSSPSTVIKGEDGLPGTMTRHTPGVRLFGEAMKKAVAYEAEFAYQLGSRANDLIRAFMVHANLSYALDVRFKPKAKLEFNYASGDSNSKDGVTRTFNPLYGSSHGPYGTIDFVRLQNMQELALFVSAKPHKTFDVLVEGHAFWLANTSDKWVNSGGTQIRPANPTATSSFAGYEIDATLKFKPIKYASIEPGIAYFIPGTYAEETAPNKADSAFLFYTMLSLYL